MHLAAPPLATQHAATVLGLVAAQLPVRLLQSRCYLYRPSGALATLTGEAGDPPLAALSCAPDGLTHGEGLVGLQDLSAS